MICASVNRDCFIVRLLAWTDSTKNWRKFRGSGQKLISLSFLAPDLQSAILDGRQPRTMTLGGLMDADIPLSWKKQREMFGAALKN